MEQNGLGIHKKTDLRVPTCSADGRLKHELDSGIRSSHRILIEVSVYSRAIRSLTVATLDLRTIFLFPPQKNMGKPTFAAYASEIVIPPRQRNLSFYLVLLVAVMPLWSIVPLSWLFVMYSLRTGIIWSFGWRGKAWFIAALCEVGVHLCRCLSRPRRYPSFQKSRNILIPI
jgi:hypothetical protein